LTRETVEFADWLADRGFHVVMPLLFGSPEQSAFVGLAKGPLVCINENSTAWQAAGRVDY